MHSMKLKPPSSDGHSDEDADNENSTDEEAPVSVATVAECLLYAGIRRPKCTHRVETALAGLPAPAVITTAMGLMESGRKAPFRMDQRVAVYSILSRAVSEWSLDTPPLSPAAVKSFVLRLLSDVDKMAFTNQFTPQQITHLARLVAILALSSFDELAVEILLSPDFTGGKPSVANSIAEEALVELFTNRVPAKPLCDSLDAIFDSIPSPLILAPHYEIVAAVVKAVHRTGVAPSPTVLFRVAELASSAVDTLSPESAEAALYLVSILDHQCVPPTLIDALDEYVLVTGTKGLDGEDCRRVFVELMRISWKFSLSLFQSKQTIEVLSLLLELRGDSVWPLGADVLTIPFLCTRARTDLKSRAGLRPTLSALAEIAKARTSALSSLVVETVESLIQIDDGSVSVDDVVSILSLIRAIDASLVSTLLVSFVERIVCSPSPALSSQFPNGLLEAEIDWVRSEARITLVAITTKTTEKDLILNHLLECIEHMPIVGMPTICHCVCLLVNRIESVPHISPTLPTAQGVLILVWLLICIATADKVNPDDSHESICACLVAIAPLIHSSLDQVWAGDSVARLVDVAEGTRSVGAEFGTVIRAIDFATVRRRDAFAAAAVDTLVTVLSAPPPRPQFIACWGELMSSLVSNLSAGEFEARLDGFFNLHAVITASSSCAAAAAQAVGRLADKRLYLILSRASAILVSTESALTSNGCERPSSVSNSLRVKLNKSSFRGLFTFEKTESAITHNLRLREFALLLVGHAVTVAPPVSLGDLPVREAAEVVLADLQADAADIPTGAASTVSLETTAAAVEAAGLIAHAFSLSPDTDFAHTFQTEAISTLLLILANHAVVESVLSALAKAVRRTTHLSPTLFSEILETVLHCLVQAIPDIPGTAGASVLADRVQQALPVVQGLLSHAESWMGFTRLLRAVFSLGGNGQVPLVRWVCVRIANGLTDDTGVVGTEQDMTEFCEAVALVLPRLADELQSVREEAKDLTSKLMLRCVHTKSGATEPVEAMTKGLPDRFVSVFLLHLIPAVSDGDAVAARFAVDTIRQVLAARAVVFAAEDSAADAVVDAILHHASSTSGCDDTRMNLISTLKFIAAVRFPIAVRELLEPRTGRFPSDRVHALHSFAREKTTLVFLVNELMQRMHSGDLPTARTAAGALGHVLDCYEDTGVAGIAVKNFSQLFVSLLVLLWLVEDGADLRLVIHKLTRAAGVSRIPDSVTAERGVALLLRANPEFKLSLAEFLLPFLTLEIGSTHRQAGVVLASQIAGFGGDVDTQLFPQFMHILGASAVEGATEVRFALRGVQAVLSRFISAGNADTPIAGHIHEVLTVLSSFITAADPRVVSEALSTLGLLARAPRKATETSFLMSHTLPLLRRVVDHGDASVRSEAFVLLTDICNGVSESKILESGEADPKHVVRFFSAVSDLWIPCLVRSQDPCDPVGDNAIIAFLAILNSAVSEEHVTLPANPSLPQLLSLVKSEICECSIVHLNSCTYYLLGLSAVDARVALAAARLAPVLIHLIPEPSKDAGVVIVYMVDKLLALAATVSRIDEVLADIIIEARRVDGSYGGIAQSS